MSMLISLVEVLSMSMSMSLKLRETRRNGRNGRREKNWEQSMGREREEEVGFALCRREIENNIKELRDCRKWCRIIISVTDQCSRQTPNQT